MLKKILYISLVVCFVTACESMQSVKRGLTGENQKNVDEFFVKKKDPLIMPPDYKNLPRPDEEGDIEEEISSFEKTLGASIGDNSSTTGTTNTTSSVEQSILKNIQSK